MPALMKPVFSSHITSVGHDPEKNEFVVEWKNGKRSVYEGVPTALAEEVRNSASVGTAIRQMIQPEFKHRYTV